MILCMTWIDNVVRSNSARNMFPDEEQFFPVGVIAISLFPEDVPPNVDITAHGRGAGLDQHPSDAIILVKRNASDFELSQDF